MEVKVIGWIGARGARVFVGGGLGDGEGSQGIILISGRADIELVDPFFHRGSPRPKLGERGRG